MGRSCLALVSTYISLTQAARREQTDDAWGKVRLLLHESVETRVADGSGGHKWRVLSGRDQVLERLRRAEVNASLLETETFRAFGSEENGLVAIEQISRLTRDDGSQLSMARCFVFEVVGDLIVRVTVYRNEL